MRGGISTNGFTRRRGFDIGGGRGRQGSDSVGVWPGDISAVSSLKNTWMIQRNSRPSPVL